METNKVTELVLENIENLILEGRVENIKKLYPPFMSQTIDKLKEMDPSKDNKYLMWLAKLLLPCTIKWFKEESVPIGQSDRWDWTIDELPTSPTSELWNITKFTRHSCSSLNNRRNKDIKDNLEHFHKNPSKYLIKDITQFQSQKQFNDAVEIAKQKLSNKEMKETGVDKIFEDDSFILLMPKTHKGACRYGSRTQWCVASRDYPGHYTSYFKRGPIFFLIDKRMTPNTYTPSYMSKAEDYWKIAIQYEPSGLQRLYGYQGDSMGEKALEMGKEDWVKQGNLSNANITYWNTRDEPKKQSAVGKYLGGPGKGQGERVKAVFNNIFPVMEKYTKRALTSFYDSLDVTKEEQSDYHNSIQKVSDLREKRQALNDKKRRLENIESSLRTITNYDDGEDESMTEWATEEMGKAGSYIQKISLAKDVLTDEIEELNEETEKFKEKIEDKKFSFANE